MHAFIACLCLARLGLAAQSPGDFAVEGDGRGHLLGSAIALGPDLDGDGLGELALSAPGHGEGRGAVFVLASGAQARLCILPGVSRGTSFARAIAFGGDRDGDGWADLVVGVPRDGPSGSVQVWSSRARTLLGTWTGEREGDEFGASLCVPGDVDGDGEPDVWIGAPGTSRRGFHFGRVQAVSGRDGSVLRVWGGDQGEDRLGEVVSSAGDFDRDGRVDLAAAAPQFTTHRPGYVRVWRSSDGLLVASLGGERAGDGFGAALAPVFDADGDGLGDLLIGAPFASPNEPAQGGAYLFSIADGRPLGQWLGGARGDRLGAAVAGLPDLDGDGASEIALGAPQGGALRRGYVRILSPKSGALLAELSGSVTGEEFGRVLESDLASSRLAIGALRGTVEPLAGRVQVLGAESLGRRRQ